MKSKTKCSEKDLKKISDCGAGLFDSNPLILHDKSMMKKKNHIFTVEANHDCK